MKWFLFRHGCSAKTALEKEKAMKQQQEKKQAFPTAVERVNAATFSCSQGHVCMSKRCKTENVQMVICPHVAKHLLLHHEDCRKQQSSSGIQNDNDDDAFDAFDSDTDIKEEKRDKCLLHKPTKPNLLLQHALTNANGDAWRRQRPLVAKALGDAKVTKKIAVPAAVQATTEAFSPNQKYGGKGSMTLEVRSFALRVSAATMVTAVFGEKMETKMYQEIQEAIMNMFDATLLPIHGNVVISTALDDPVRKVIDNMAIKMTLQQSDSFSNPCLAHNLLQLESKSNVPPLGTSPSSNTNTLSRDEVVGNCHSALLAGTQTISTTLTGAILHLAEYDELQHFAKPTTTHEKKTCLLSVVRETLRILPPVATLPRCLVDGDASISAKTSEQGNTTTAVVVPKGGAILMDVFSMAHTGNARSSNIESNSDKSKDEGIPEPTVEPNWSTWKFSPKLGNEHKEKNKPQAYPWGLGSRQCPAGALSVACIRAILEHILVQEGLCWNLLHPGMDGVGPRGVRGWVEKVVYRPSLSFPHHLWVCFYKENVSEEQS